MKATIFIFLILNLLCQSYGSVLVTLPGLGTLRGGVGKARNNDEFYRFRGVPFAAPPIGGGRFRMPDPVEAWEGIREAVEYGNVCVHSPYEDLSKIIGSEDCLYLNVFTKNVNSWNKAPVLVYIHGGAFIFGSSRSKGPEYLMEEDIVLVTIQYRLNAFGFLSTEDSVCPGNYGLHDQMAALRWVQQNIRYFGGDPDLVTIMGLSAGGSSVDYLLLSPLTEGLFQRAVSFSGSSLCWWSNLPKQAKTTHKFAKLLNCPVNSSEDLVDCLRTKSTQELMSSQSSLYSWHPGKLEREPMNVWSPRTDTEAGLNSILPVMPYQAMVKGLMKNIPYLVGITMKEGIWRGINYIGQEKLLDEFVKNFSNIGSHALGLEDDVPEGKLKDILETIRTYYFGMDEINLNETKAVTGLIDILGDTMFNYPVDEMIKLYSSFKAIPLFVFTVSYRYTHSDATVVGKLLGLGEFEDLQPELQDATHGAECQLMFPNYVDILGLLSQKETQVSRNFVKLLVEFARKGNPTAVKPGWKPVTVESSNHLDIGEQFTIRNSLPFQEQLKFWKDLPIYWTKDKNPENPATRDEL